MESELTHFQEQLAADLSAIAFDPVVQGLVQGALIDPVQEILLRPSKRFRAELVDAGYRLASAARKSKADESTVGKARLLIESIHSGSLVVDDIQDESDERRGKPTLHRLYGIPTALNAGNWLYFWPLAQVAEWGLKPTQEVSLYRLCHSTLKRAHYGQALDVSVRIDQSAQDCVSAICNSAIAMKSGALTELAIGLGAIVGDATLKQLTVLREFGFSFGCGLQKLDDLGNLLNTGIGLKRFEDLKLRRPSWIWSFLAERLDAEEYRAWTLAVEELPDSTTLLSLWNGHGLSQVALDFVRVELTRALTRLRAEFGEMAEFEGTYQDLQQLTERLLNAYRSKT